MNDRIKSPFNWVGNKIKYVERINQIISGKQYSMVVDMMMGSGNILLNIDKSTSKVFFGNDKQKLVPMIFERMKTEEVFSIMEIERNIDLWNRFSSKEDYYSFRDHWNKKYLSDKFDRDFIIETSLLLKMCSNSMVRFNPKEGYFNQGFRGLGEKKEFFKDEMKEILVSDLNSTLFCLQKYSFKFSNKDVSEYRDSSNGRLLIVDPPYILRSDMYDNDFSKATDEWILSFLSQTENDFIYFNYSKRGNEENKSLLGFSEKYKKKVISIIPINSKTMAGQQRSKNIIDVEEVMVTNVQM